MTNRKKLALLTNILPWTYAALMFSWEFFIEGQPVRPRTFSIGLYVFYGHLFLFQRYLASNQYRFYFCYLAVLLLSAGLPYVIFSWLTTGTAGSSYLYPLDLNYWQDVTFFLFNSVIIGVVHLLIRNSFTKEELQKQVLKTELDYLKSQINPHFLFNTLNNIHTLVYLQAPAAPEAVMRLSSLMRYMLYESNATAVPLSRELDNLNDYIGLQQLRYKAPDVVNFEVEGHPEGFHLAPLLFIPLLENSYKHGPALLETGAIQLCLTVSGQSLVFTCRNPVGTRDDKGLETPGGIGLANVRKRLQLLYPGKHQLEVQTTNGVYTVTLTLANLQKGRHDRKVDLLHHR